MNKNSLYTFLIYTFLLLLLQHMHGQERCFGKHFRIADAAFKIIGNSTT